MDVFGRPKCGVFVRLNASARNCMCKRSTNCVSLTSEKSRLCTLGLRTDPMVRDTLPNFHGSGRLNASVLNHSLTFCELEREDESFGLTPGTAFGRFPG